ncbi:hypothetical protein [Bradyrhizobium japonicum]|uniref:LeuD/DmdB family oxidoreductase small subunit n=1 Tax=Bradyrhizobium japonicum TaxID=375 RepID=UPI00200DCAF8|nr:hypothetical protein [Bradyrhizobium japonicum]UQE03625.1 hypothetical protein JEY30_47725 [Bradyrhizobium japonicum]
MSTYELRVRRISGIISTDDIIPGRYKHMFTDPGMLAPHVFENYCPGLAGSLREGDAICSSDLFGIGSSREQAVSALRSAGVRAVLAPQFGRIFFRNCWNLGLAAIELKELSALEDGARFTLDIAAGAIKTSRDMIRFSPPPQLMLQMLSAGGLLAVVKARLAEQRENDRGAAAGGTLT